MKRAAMVVVAGTLLALGILQAENRKKPSAAQQSPAVAAPAAKPETPTTSPAAGKSATAGKDARGVAPLSLAYVPRDAIAVIAVRPPTFLNCPAFAAIHKLVAARATPEMLHGFVPERIEQVTLVLMFEEGPAFTHFKMPDGSPAVMSTGGRVIRPEPVAAILRLARAEDIPPIVTALAPDSEESTFSGKTYFRTKGDDQRSFGIFIDDLTLAIASEAHLRRLIVAGREGASNAKWAQPWKSAAGADALALANVAAIRHQIALMAKDLGSTAGLTINPPSAAPLFDSATAIIAVDLRDRISARLQLTAESPSDVERIRSAFKTFISLHQAALSPLRTAASFDAGENGATFLGVLDILDSALDDVAINTKDALIAASATLSMDDAAKLGGWLASSLDDGQETNGAADNGEDGLEKAPEPEGDNAVARPAANRGALIQPPAEDESATAGEDATEVAPLSLAYVPRDAIAVVALRPPALLKCPALAAIHKLVCERLNPEKLLGFAPDRIEQLTLVFMFQELLQERTALENFTLPDGTSVGAILHLANADDVAALVTMIQPDPEEGKYAGRTYIRGKEGSSRASCIFVDQRTVVIADEDHLRRLIVAGQDGASKAKWTQSWQKAAGADALALANLRAIRSLIALTGKGTLINNTPPSAAPLLEAATALLAVEAKEQINFKFDLSAAKPADGERLAVALRSFITLEQASLSLVRTPASSDSGAKGAARLEALDLLDAALDSVQIAYYERDVHATAAVTADDATKIVGGWITAILDDGPAEHQSTRVPERSEKVAPTARTGDQRRP